MGEEGEDLFDAVYALEQQEYKSGEAEGLQEGDKKHHQQGFTLGWQQACHLLHELGIIEGLVGSVVLNRREELSPRAHRQATKLLEDLQGWPCWDPTEEGIEDRLRGIHTRTRNLLQRLGISAKVIERSVDAEF